MPRTPRSVGQLLRNIEQLNHLQAELARQARILGHLRVDLPAELVTHLVAARVKGGDLLLYVDTPAWATRLRFLAPQALRAARRAAPVLNSLTVRVSVAREPAAPAHALRPISPAAAAVIGEAGTAVADEALRAALLRLARRGRG